jgi:hypothetical protein
LTDFAIIAVAAIAIVLIVAVVMAVGTVRDDIKDESRGDD